MVEFGFAAEADDGLLSFCEDVLFNKSSAAAAEVLGNCSHSWMSSFHQQGNRTSFRDSLKTANPASNAS